MAENVSRTRLQREWVLCAIAAAASRFVPVPLADDLIKTRATRTAVARTWTAHGRPDCPAAIGILAEDSTGLLTGLARWAAKLPLLIVLYPIRKTIRLVTAVRGVSTDLVDVVLLARSVDRCLRAGWFADSDRAVLERQAEIVRRAHDQVIDLADLRILTRAVASSLRQFTHLRTQAPAFARRVFGAPARSTARFDTAGPTTTEQETQVEQGVQEVVAAFDRPEVTTLLAELDQRFDDALGALAGAASVTVPGPAPSPASSPSPPHRAPR